MSLTSAPVLCSALLHWKGPTERPVMRPARGGQGSRDPPLPGWEGRRSGLHPVAWASESRSTSYRWPAVVAEVGRSRRGRCRTSGAPPRPLQEGMLELTEAPRSEDRGGENSRRLPPAEARKGRTERHGSAGSCHTDECFRASSTHAKTERANTQ